MGKNNDRWMYIPYTFSIEGYVTDQKYRNEILDPHVNLFKGAYGLDFLFMEVIARTHRANLVYEFLERKAIERTPAKPPDLNPVELL
ncbi:hypothetical protein NPIL_524521 [Nephila pilipes]|uniref:Uncharacterized protein n=1 Tax=Nephila pilipes TaxID=299642 RepID=A0A8X6UMY2_NEPPI|nr:hypothetical protein NPIL_524521 [Nephila pilipes]